MSYRHVLDRRTLLRGAGGVAIGLPFLDAMRATSVYAADPEPPPRALTVFFGLGVPAEIQAEGLTGALEPLAPFQDRLSWLRGVHLREADGRANNHFDGGGGIFVGLEPRSDSVAGGPSIDQVMRESLYPNGLPTGIPPALVAGSFFRRSRLTRYVHSWSNDGSPVDVPIETPAALFERVFGSAPVETPDAKSLRYRRSILDAVLADYRRWSGPGSALGVTDRRALSDHLERLRELEQRIFPDRPEDASPNGCGGAEPGSLPLLNGQPADPDGEGVDIELDQWVRVWESLVDVYVMAFRCDRARFGSILFQSAGERVRLRGNYRYEGREIYDFDDRRDRGRGGAAGCSHEFWHAYQASRPNVEMRHHTHFMMAQVRYLLQRLDDADYLDENGGSLFDNTMLMLGTELGDGNRHDLRSVFHAVAGGNQRFAPGTHDVDAEALDVYDTVLSAYGLSRRMSPPGRSGARVDALLR